MRISKFLIHFLANFGLMLVKMRLLGSIIIILVFRKVFGDYRDYIDLTYEMSEETIFFPGQPEFHLKKETRRNATSSSFYYASNSFCTGEHGGTHLDAPIHFSPSGWSVNQIPNSRLFDIPGVVVDVSDKVFGSPRPANANYTITSDDVEDYESEYGRIPKNALVIFKTGWGMYWHDKEKYLGEKNGELEFPGVDVGTAQWLHFERNIVGIGIDTASIDPGYSKQFKAHQFLADKQIYNLENVANLHLISGRNKKPSMMESINSRSESEVTYEEWRLSKCTAFNFFVLPLKITGGTGAPVRILAKCLRKTVTLVESDEDDYSSDAVSAVICTCNGSEVYMFLFAVALFYISA